uniref:Major facilitator superfamily (MFS) profile domain-containing protein n=1 Tax=Neogobius melanostomus TaxID=47308 RepID=A0A8C6TRN1_9GOBI
MFAVLMLFNGAGNIANFVAAFIAGAEIFTGNVQLLFITLGMGLTFSTGYLLMPFLAFFLRDWKSFQMAISLPILLYLPFWWVIPESPRWLLSQGRVDEAEAIVRKAADMNKVNAPPVVFEDEMTEGLRTEKEKRYTVLDVFKTSNIRTTTMILCFLWFSVAVGYFGVTLNTSKLTHDPYLGSCISAMVEMPAYLVTWLSVKRIPRRVFISSAMVLGGVCLLLLPAIPPSLRWLSVTLEMIGKFFVVATQNLLFAYTAEVFPTVLRNTATGVCSTWGRIGSCISPFIIQLRLYFTFLPPVVIGTLTVGSAIGALFLPETARQPLPETIQDMQHHKRIKFPCLGRQKTTTSSIGHVETKL